jgi:hypothetical protein
MSTDYGSLASTHPLNHSASLTPRRINRLHRLPNPLRLHLRRPSSPLHDQTLFASPKHEAPR